MVINCKQCNRAFKITDSEINFYRRKGLDLPKRCKNCRALNKSKKVNIQAHNNNDYSYQFDNYTESYARKNYFPIVAVITTLIIIASIITMIIVINPHKAHTNSVQTAPVTYYLNTYRHKFHETDCPSVWEMNSKNRKAFYGTREEAIQQGYSPCQNCKP